MADDSLAGANVEDREANASGSVARSQAKAVRRKASNLVRRSKCLRYLLDTATLRQKPSRRPIREHLVKEIGVEQPLHVR